MGALEIFRIVVSLAAAPLLPRGAAPLPPLPPPASSVSAASSASGSDDAQGLCFAPFFYSGDGIKRYVLACLTPAATVRDPMVPDCTVPFTIDEAGRHHYVTECLGGVEEPCVVPWSFDADGTKRYDAACLSP